MHVERLFFHPAFIVVAVAAPPVSRQRAYGTGSLFAQPTTSGGETWYGQFRVSGRLVKRALGPKRGPRTPEGLTRTQAERKLRQLIEATRPLPAERLAVAEAGRRLIAHLGELGRKRSTLAAYESCLRVHLVPFFGSRPLHRITRDDVEAFIAAKAGDGLAPKSILNYLGTLQSTSRTPSAATWSPETSASSLTSRGDREKWTDPLSRVRRARATARDRGGGVRPDRGN
jgi:hypothetical protein